MRSEATGLAAEAALFHALSDPSRLLIVVVCDRERFADGLAPLGLGTPTDLGVPA